MQSATLDPEQLSQLLGAPAPILPLLAGKQSTVELDDQQVRQVADWQEGLGRKMGGGNPRVIRFNPDKSGGRQGG